MKRTLCYCRAFALDTYQTAFRGGALAGRRRRVVNLLGVCGWLSNIIPMFRYAVDEVIGQSVALRGQGQQNPAGNRLLKLTASLIIAFLQSIV